MILYYILENRSNQLAQAWHEGSYASVRYPKANLTSQRISDLLSAVGDEGSQRAFFAEISSWLGAPWRGEGDHRQYGTAQQHPLPSHGRQQPQRQDIKRGEADLRGPAGHQSAPVFPPCPRERHRRVHPHPDDSGTEGSTASTPSSRFSMQDTSPRTT
jgi:hypothetical protein